MVIEWDPVRKSSGRCINLCQVGKLQMDWKDNLTTTEKRQIGIFKYVVLSSPKPPKYSTQNVKSAKKLQVLLLEELEITQLK